MIEYILTPRLLGTMAKKLKKKSQLPLPPPFQPPGDEDEDLIQDLMAQLDSKNETVQAESASMLREIADAKDDGAHRKADPKSRFLARQVGLSRLM